MKNAKFFTVDQVKEHFGVKSIKVLENPKTGKKFVAIDDETYLKCEQVFDPTKPMAFIVGEENFDKKGNPKMEEACLINVKEGQGATTIATL